MAANFTKVEQEVIALKAIWELIDETVNYSMFQRLTRTDDAQLSFQSSMHQRLFNILLVDFLSQPGSWPFGLAIAPKGAPESERSVLLHLKRIANDPCLNPTGGSALKLPLEAFLQWLETECFVENVWLPSINIESDIRVKRISFIKICGNIAKHSFARLSVNVREICEILKANGRTIDPEQGYLVIPNSTNGSTRTFSATTAARSESF